MSEPHLDSHAVKAAAFLIQALELDDDPAALAGDVLSLKRDPNAGISTLELESSVGPAAFLIYDYQLAVANADGIDGRTLFVCCDGGIAPLRKNPARYLPRIKGN